jgi:hypothetical protein
MATLKPSPNAQFSAFLSRFSPEIVALVKRCLPKIRRAVPCSYQLVYEYSNSLVVAFSTPLPAPTNEPAAPWPPVVHL